MLFFTQCYWVGRILIYTPQSCSCILWVSLSRCLVLCFWPKNSLVGTRHEFWVWRKDLAAYQDIFIKYKKLWTHGVLWHLVLLLVFPTSHFSVVFTQSEMPSDLNEDYAWSYKKSKSTCSKSSSPSSFALGALKIQKQEDSQNLHRGWKQWTSIEVVLTGMIALLQ